MELVWNEGRLISLLAACHAHETRGLRGVDSWPCMEHASQPTARHSAGNVD